jgi:hypothetical protein
MRPELRSWKGHRRPARTLATIALLGAAVLVSSCEDPTGGNPICVTCNIFEPGGGQFDWELDFVISNEYQLMPVSDARLRATTLDASWRCYYGFDEFPPDEWSLGDEISESFDLADGTSGPGPGCDSTLQIPFSQLDFVLEYVSAEGPSFVVLQKQP